jgi:O-antigen/teichoic acid export membrane protein
MASKVVFGTDVLIIGIFLPVSAITFYSIPSMLVTYMRNLVSTATWVLNPFTSEMESKADPSTIVDLLERGTKFSYLVGLPICAVFLIMGKEFISLWVGTEYGERASSVLIILTIGCLSGLGHLAINAILYGLSRHHIIAYVRTLEAILNIVLTLVMVRIWDLVGVALGMAVSHLLLMGIVLPYLVCRTIDCSYKTYIMKSIFFPLIAVIPFALLCFAVNIKYPAKNLFMFFISVFSILPVYLASAWYISFSKEERKSYILFISKFMHGKKKT